MSQADMRAIADRWHCSVAEVEVRITDALKAARLIDDSVERVPVDTAAPARWLTVGVTTDDRLAILDRDDNVLFWLEGPMH